MLRFARSRLAYFLRLWPRLAERGGGLELERAIVHVTDRLMVGPGRSQKRASERRMKTIRASANLGQATLLPRLLTPYEHEPFNAFSHQL